ncbi:Asparagine synthetase [glutamine-hydrolyzing] 1 [Paraglaciecola mesophila]|uniref:asparagine synthase (glutamine-hydrolyzing) n=1 Tax=Paraglaciecola mesophila TaxID=197222 RepID=A0A857JQZ3_9ALTE|nr:asparagine synthase-related protein [Paraglaciecola mesophila]QHJ13590.1 Asparagine synthetase [glutamine-hydrolyzing] 1 [Paraglaciecola mesophila]
MPGIYGYTKNESNEDNIHLMSTALIVDSNDLIIDDIVNDSSIQMSHIHLKSTKNHKKTFNKNGIFISIQGEKYNYIENTFEELLYESYINQKLKDILSKIDGYFHAIIYDSINKKVHLITDRYGMSLLYYCYTDNKLAWSAEVKGLLALPRTDYTLNEVAINSFLELGYLVENETLLKNIELVPPSTIISYDLKSSNLEQTTYWKWSEIKLQNVSFDSAVEQLGTLFLASVKKRFSPDEKMGVSLSGGLDSRAIIAAVNTLYPDYIGELYTFGIEGCDDIEIAKIVAKKTKWKHTIYNFSESNWFESRFNSIWRTDGMLSMMHMHGIEFLEEVSNKITFNLNGYAGDVVCGGGWLNHLPLDKQANNSDLKQFYKNQTDRVDFDSDFYAIDKCEPHLLMNRVRRFTNMGSVNSLHKITQRKPFFDNNLIEFVYSLPDYYRKDNKLYADMLIKFFPDFFENIPWQKTRKTLLGKESNLLSYPKISRGYINYAKGIRDEEVLRKITNMLHYESSRYSKFTNIDPISQYLNPHLASFKVNHVENIFRFVTLEYYLQRTSIFQS